ncbi:hypothetical protein SDC9_59379 [bioreactor metagenome]|uniref:Periplasmic heavy metal sensor n=1 Tax=bioreactor metagenome TaxID=1076179 RepID=A0A644XFX1_9ZZZZ
MKNKNVIIWILTVVSTISVTALITLWLIRPAAPDMYPFHHNSDRQHNTEGICENRMMEKLNLRDEQKEKFTVQFKYHHERIDPVFDSLRTLRASLFDELDKDSPDTAVINSCIGKISVQELNLQKESIDHLLSMKKFLDPVQFDTLLSMHKRAMMPMRKGAGNNHNQHCNNNK